MKIVKMQAGSQLPFVDYIPVTQNVYSGKGATTASSSGKKETDALDKALYKVIEEGGLTSDSNYFYSIAESILQDASLGMASKFSSEHTVTQLIQLRKVANQLKENKNLYDEAVDHMRSENTGDDYALTTDGKVYVGRQTEEGKFELNTVKISELKEKLNEWSPITNKTLLQLRDSSNEFAFRKDMLLDVSGSIGMDDVMTTVDNIIKRFGKLEKTTNELRVGSDVKEGLEGLYKITVEQSNVTLTPEVKKAAAKFIMSNLNNNAKNVLKLNATMAGVDTDNYLINTIVLASDTMYKEELSKTIEALNKEKGKSTDGGDKPTERSFINTVVLGEAVEDKDILLSGTDGVGIKARGQAYGFRDESGNRIAMGNMENILTQKDNALGNVVDVNSISIGNTLVNTLDLHKIVYDGSSTLNRMYLPIDEDVYAATGHIKPDFDALDKFQKFKKWSKDNPNASPQEQAIKAEDLGLSIQYDSNANSWKFRNTHLFLSLNGYVSEELIPMEDSDKKYLSHMDKSTRKELLDLYENYVNYGQSSPDKDKKHPNSVNLVSFFDWVGQSNLYQGMIFMPVLDRGMEYIAASNEIVPKSDFMDMKNKRSLQDQQRNFKSNF